MLERGRTEGGKRRGMTQNRNEEGNREVGNNREGRRGRNRQGRRGEQSKKVVIVRGVESRGG